MKSILASIKPKWCELIANGKKTIEVRKTKPKIDVPFKCYIYCTVGGDALCPPHTNSAKWDIHRQNNGTINGRKMTARERDESDYHFANGKVIGEFVCLGIDEIECSSDGYNYFSDYSCLNIDEFIKYCNGKTLYAWQISNLVIYDKPKELSCFGLKRPPQSWCYVEESEQK